MNVSKSLGPVEQKFRTSSEVIAYLTCAVDPEDDNKYEGDSFCDLCSRKALYYYIVPGENVTTCERTKVKPKLFFGFLDMR